MKPPFLHLRLFAITLLNFSLASHSSNNTNVTEDFKKCNRFFGCGPIQRVTYPFWGNSLPEYCGRKEFRLMCVKNTTQIIIADQKFRVKWINLMDYQMRIAPWELSKDVCSHKNGTLSNITLNHDLFDYWDTVLNIISVYYQCPRVSGNPWNFTCMINGTTSMGYFAGEAPGSKTKDPRLSVNCKAKILVPLRNASYEELFSMRKKLHEAIGRGFYVRYKADAEPCDRCQNSGGICGSNQDSKFVCHKNNGGGKVQKVVTGHKVEKIVMGIALTLGTISILSCLILMASKSIFKVSLSSKMASIWVRKNGQDVEEMIRHYGSSSPKRYKYSDVKKMTESFREKLGQGGYGSVYKGILIDGRLVAVKVLNATKGNGEEFINELASISQTSHVNIVSLLGFCFEGDRRYLIYEFMANGSLEKFICHGRTLQAGHDLGWKKLFEIAIGIARGLEYLHRLCNKRILHFDIKPHNILLDEAFCPKISDFGLAKLCSKKESIVSMRDTRGTIGYMAPELLSIGFGGVSHKSDVYSYGRMVLEMAGGANFPHWVYKRLESGQDLGLQGTMNEEESEIAKKMVLVGFWCTQKYTSDRPSIKEALDMLEGSLVALKFPPKPYMFSPNNSPVGCESCNVVTVQ